MNYTECLICHCTPKPDEWSGQVEGVCYDCGQYLVLCISRYGWTDLDIFNGMKKLEEIWIIIAWILLFPLVLMLKLLGKLKKKT